MSGHRRISRKQKNVICIYIFMVGITNTKTVQSRTIELRILHKNERWCSSAILGHRRKLFKQKQLIFRKKSYRILLPEALNPHFLWFLDKMELLPEEAVLQPSFPSFPILPFSLFLLSRSSHFCATGPQSGGVNRFRQIDQKCGINCGIRGNNSYKNLIK